MAKFADMEEFPHVFQVSSHTIRDGGSFEMKGRWNELFFKNDNPIVLELGCGKGEYTVGLAELYPEKNFVGVDIKGARLWTGAKESIAKSLKNVAFLRTNIENIDLFFGQGEVAEIWLTFPDPQMKKTRKRLTATNFIESYRAILVENGIVHLKSDSNFMYLYTDAMVAENQFELLRQTDDLYHSDILDEVLSIQTFYEKQWLDRGINIKYLSFRLSHQEPLREPDVEIEIDPYRSFGRSAKE